MESILSTSKYDDNVASIAAMSTGSQMRLYLLYYRIGGLRIRETIKSIPVKYTRG